MEQWQREGFVSFNAWRKAKEKARWAAKKAGAATAAATAETVAAEAAAMAAVPTTASDEAMALDEATLAVLKPSTQDDALVAEGARGALLAQRTARPAWAQRPSLSALGSRNEPLRLRCCTDSVRLCATRHANGTPFRKRPRHCLSTCHSPSDHRLRCSARCQGWAVDSASRVVVEGCSVLDSMVLLVRVGDASGSLRPPSALPQPFLSPPSALPQSFLGHSGRMLSAEIHGATSQSGGRFASALMALATRALTASAAHRVAWGLGGSQGGHVSRCGAGAAPMLAPPFGRGLRGPRVTRFLCLCLEAPTSAALCLSLTASTPAAPRPWG